jgi:hypothetical protein
VVDKQKTKEVMKPIKSRFYAMTRVLPRRKAQLYEGERVGTCRAPVSDKIHLYYRRLPRLEQPSEDVSRKSRAKRTCRIFLFTFFIHVLQAYLKNLKNSKVTTFSIKKDLVVFYRS